MSNQQKGVDFINHWNNRDIEGIMSSLSEDCFYHNIPMDPQNGKEEIRMLKRQLKNAQNEMIKMRAADVGGQQERSSLEELFLRCVDTIKKDVERRKANPSTGFKPTRDISFS